MSTTPLTKSAIAIDEVETLVLHHALKLLQFVGEAGHIPTRLLEDIERMTGSRPAMWSVNEKINTLKKLLAPMWKFETEDRTGIEAGTHTSGAEDGNEKEEMGQGEIQSNWDEIVGSFEDMNLNPDLLRSIQTHGFDRPTSIQQHAILPLIKNHDLICQAPSGTGKTAYVISILQNLDTTVPDCQALIIVPNHELAQQIQRFVSTLGEPLKADCHACIGGTNVREDVKRFKFESDSARPHIVVGTLGRVHDLINRRALRIEAIKCFVIDEADDMLSRAFKEQMYGLAKIVPQTAQKALFAATLSQEVSDFTEKFMRKPYQIKFRHLEKVTLDGIKQYYVPVEEDKKLNTLCELFKIVSINQAVIFCNTRKRVEYLNEQFRARELTVSAVHGGMDETQLEAMMTEFRSGSSRFLVATDLMAHDIDVQQVFVIVNYDVSSNRSIYIRRISCVGHTFGSSGRKGVAISLATPNAMRMLKDIEEFYHTQIDEIPENVADLIQD